MKKDILKIPLCHEKVSLLYKNYVKNTDTENSKIQDLQIKSAIRK
jgi:hypothetical protein